MSAVATAIEGRMGGLRRAGELSGLCCRPTRADRGPRTREGDDSGLSGLLAESAFGGRPLFNVRISAAVSTCPASSFLVRWSTSGIVLGRGEELDCLPLRSTLLDVVVDALRAYRFAFVAF